MSETNENIVQENGAGTVMALGQVVKTIADMSNSTKNPLSQAEVHTALSLLKTVICDALKRGQKVQLTSFVSFIPQYRAPRKGNNVLTREPLNIPEGVMVVAKAGSNLRGVVKDISDDTKQAIKAKALSKKKTVG